MGQAGAVLFGLSKLDFFKNFNLLLIDLQGHGASKDLIHNPFKSKYSFESIAEDIFEVLDHLKIAEVSFCRYFSGYHSYKTVGEMQPERVEKMIMGGAVLELNLRSKF